MDTLMGYDWPGNVRELQNLIERSLILATGSELKLMESLGPDRPIEYAARRSLSRDLRETERQQIVAALQTSLWKIKGEGNAASRLGLKPSTLRSRMKRLGIERLD
jgi:formate hydrogenlyase transcriptional activator